MTLFVAGVASLFLELLLIRYLSTEVYAFASLQNLVLIACFLGLGIGSWTCRESASIRRVLALMALTLAIFVVPFARQQLLILNGLGFFVHHPSAWAETFKNPGALPQVLGILAVLYLLLGLVAALFVPLGRIVGRGLDEAPRPVRAYSQNVAGSLVGIWLFAALGVASQPPLVWVGVSVLTLVWLARLRGENALVAVALGAVVLVLMGIAQRDPGTFEVVWSPYQKVSLALPGPDPKDWSGIGKYIVKINCQSSYQGLLDLRPVNVAAHPEQYPPELAGLSQYDVPAQLHPLPRRALIVGAGTGNDVAGLLRNGVEHVTAVDIDPAIVRLGKKYHPEKPYSDPRVTVIADDARSFLASSREQFDLIVFGLLDSHTGASGSTNRLDSYVYTQESLTQARRLLAPGGTLVLSFEPGFGNFVLERLLLTLTRVFGQQILFFRIPSSAYGWGGVLFVASNDTAKVIEHIKSKPRLARQVAEWGRDFTIGQGQVDRVATDDWPYLYIRSPRVPQVYGVLVGLPLLMFALLGWRRSRLLLTGWRGTHTHFALLGCAFMLLETQNVSKTCMLFGNSWWVNAVVITGIMILILLANLIVERFPRLPLLPVYLALWLTCGGLYLVNLNAFAGLPYAIKVVWVGLLVSFPMLFSGIVFIRSFGVMPDKDHALGANLLGSMVGGGLQALTFVLGFKALLIVVALLYLAAYPCRPRSTG